MAITILPPSLIDEPIMHCCEVCGKDMPEYDPKFCCDGYVCGCMGLPTEPPVCCKECYVEYKNRLKTGKTEHKLYPIDISLDCIDL